MVCDAVQSVQPRKGKKRGRKPLNVDTAKRIELSRQNARECRARKKLRYQYVEELVVSREKAVETLRQELATVITSILQLTIIPSLACMPTTQLLMAVLFLILIACRWFWSLAFYMDCTSF